MASTNASDMTSLPQDYRNNLMHPCVVCQASMEVFTWEHVELDTCPKGHGVWFDFGELKAVSQATCLSKLEQELPHFQGELQEPPSVAQQIEGSALHVCPVDGSELHRFEWNVGSGVVLDKCPTCQGIWMDAGEMSAYAKAMAKYRELEGKAIDPSVQAKLKETHAEAEKRYTHSLDQATRKIIDWDASFLDDMIRGTMKLFMRNL